MLEGLSLFPTPEIFTFDNFGLLLNETVRTYIINSVLVAAGTIVVVVSISLISAYGLSRFRFRGRVNFARFLLFGYMFSPIVLGIPLYMIWRDLQLLDTRYGLVIALSAVALPFSVWLMWKYMQTIPIEYEETAWVEGASRWRAFRDVIVPQCRPPMVAVSLFAFAISWNNFTYPFLLVPSDAKTTFPPGLLRYISTSPELGHNEIMAVCLALTIPPFLFAYFLQSYILTGFTVRAT
jgi:multiple sugar transport system permease protein